MTAPRRLLPNTTYLVTRHCTQHEWLLRGESDTNAIFLYWLAVAAERSGVEVHGFIQMADHWHAVVTDPKCTLPDFVHDLDLGVAFDMNSKLARRENFWSSGRTAIIPLQTADLVVEKLAEMITHPVADGLVKSPGEWPGSLSTGLCEVHVASRPKSRSAGSEESIPEQARLECTMPPALRGLPSSEASRNLRARVAVLLERARARARKGGGFLGADRVRTMPRSGPRAPSGGPVERKHWVTRLAKRVRLALDAQMKDFLDAYNQALWIWRRHDRWVEFPDGTYLMRVLHRAVCRSPRTV